MTRLDIKDKFSGCIIGQAVGDALGFIAEGHSPENCEAYVNRVLDENNEFPFKRGPYPLGQYSDDTQLARELMLSIVQCKAFNPEDYAVRIANIFAENRIVGWGLATREAAERLIAGISWRESGEPFPSAGNGSAMRAAPIGLLYYNQPNLIIKSAIDQSIITHSDPRCCAGSVAIAGATALVLQLDNLNANKFLDQLAAWTEAIDVTVSEGLQALQDWLDLPPGEAVHYVANYGYQSGYENDWHGISPYVISSVLWSLYAFLKIPDDYLESIRISIAVGGDVDTTGAMTGAISGAFNGISSIPGRYVKLLNDCGSWNHSELADLAGRLYELAAC